MATWAELYEKVKIETEESRKPFKEYKKVRKTFTELFENANPEEAQKLQESKNTYSALYEQYVKPEPLNEQEAIYILAKLDSGEKLTESEIQKLEELNTVNWSLGRSLGNLVGLNTAKQRAYNQMRAAGKLQGQQIKQAKADAWAANKYGGQLKAGQDQINKLNAQIQELGLQKSPDGKFLLDNKSIANLKMNPTKIQTVGNILKQVGGAAVAVAGGIALGPLVIPAASAAAAGITAGMAPTAVAAALGISGAASASAGVIANSKSNADTNENTPQPSPTSSSSNENTITKNPVESEGGTGSPSTEKKEDPPKTEASS